MFNFSFGELLLIGVIALLVLGPERLPGAARTAGMWIGKIRRTISDLQNEVTSQFEAEELRKELRETQNRIDSGLSRLKKSVQGTEDELRQSLQETENEIRSSMESASAPEQSLEAQAPSPPAPAAAITAPFTPPKTSRRPVIANHALNAPLTELRVNDLPPSSTTDDDSQPQRKE